MPKLCFRYRERKDEKCFKKTTKYNPSPWCWNCTNTKSGCIPRGEFSHYEWGREIENKNRKMGD